MSIGSSIEDMERQLIIATLARLGGDKAQAASVLGISLKTLYARLKVYQAAGQSMRMSQPTPSGVHEG
jgi:DNA-binding NtrC family response regulator